MLGSIRQAISHDSDHVSAAPASFEDLAGPLQRLRATLAEVHQVMNNPPDRESLLHHLRPLYAQLTGVVLTDLERGCQRNEAGSRRLGRIAHLLVDVARFAAVDVFTLNYDLLLDRHLIRACSERRAPGDLLADSFHPAKDDLRIGGLSIEANRLRDDAIPERRYEINLSHLHGSSRWVRQDGAVFKLSGPQMRDHTIHALWMRGDLSAGDPVVVLTDQKRRETLLDPFSTEYVRLRQALSRAEVAVVVGYGFGDVPLNEELAGRPASVPLVVVSGTGSESEQWQVRERVGGEIDFIPANAASGVDPLAVRISAVLGTDITVRRR